MERLEQQDIIENITSEATPWLSQLIIVTKSDGGVRLFIDMRNANAAIERTRFPTPTMDDLIFKLTVADIPGAINIAYDILIFAGSITEHDEILKHVFQRLQAKGLALNLSKCIFSKEHLE